MLRIIISITFWLVVSSMSFAAEDPDLNKLFDEINGKSDIYKKFKTLMENPERDKRLAAFEVMVTKGDSTLREIALNSAFFGSDTALRARALKTILFSRGNFVLQFGAENGSFDAPLVTPGKSFPDQFGFDTASRHPDVNCIGLEGRSCRYRTMTVSGLQVTITRDSPGASSYSAALTLSEDGVLRGYFDHDDFKNKVPAYMKVY